MQTDPPSALILSPHRDDAAFSCSLATQHLVGRGWQVSVANVCTISDYAPYRTQQAEDQTTDVTAARALEDERYADTAQTTHWWDLRWQDAPLRLHIDTEAVLTTPVPDRHEVEQLAEQLAALPQHDVVLVPMALGGHIDHLLVRAAASLAFPEARTIFYEDLPYACRMSATERDAALKSNWVPCLLGEGRHAGSKAEAAMCYPSQIESAVAAEMETYCAALGHRERLFAASAQAAQRLAQGTRKDAGGR